MKKLFALALLVGLFCLSEPVFTQEQPAQKPSAEELEKQKAEREKNAYTLLDQVIDEAQSLRLTENRVRVQMNAADMLWDSNQGRARSLFMMAGDGVAELGRTQSTPPTRGGGNATQWENVRTIDARAGMRSFQLRQELVLTAARHDAQLAYQLLAATKPPMPVQNTADQRGPRPQATSEENLEQALLARVAALDPKLAAQNADQMIEKGQFPRSLGEVIKQLRGQDAEAADKLADKTVKRLQATNLLTNEEAGMLAQALLNPGPRLPAGQGATEQTGRRTPVLDQAAYVELLSSAVDAALKMTTTNQNVPRGQANVRRVQGGPGVNVSQNVNQTLTQAQVEQINARRLFAGLQPALSMIDQYLPAKAPLVRQKLSEIGIPLNQLVTSVMPALAGNPTADALVQAAANAPQQMQSRLYQQAAFKALEEGDTERARQIATDHLQNNARDQVMQRIDFRELATRAEGTRIEEIRQAVARLQSDNQKVDMLLQVARTAQKTNPKLALQVLEEARQITNRRATAYEHFEQQLRVARAFSTVDPARSFEVLEPGITQLNELLSAAQVLSGFEISMFRDGEMSMQAGNGLTSTINRFGQELAVLARNDFERAETLAGRFQYAEPRIMARLSIVRALLEVKPSEPQPGPPTLRSDNVIRQD